MKMWTRWQDWTTLVCGVILVLAPWMFGLVSITAFTIEAWLIGGLSIVVALFSLSQPRRFVTEWMILLLGIWLLISPWTLSFSTVGAAAAIAWITGLLLLITSGWILGETRRFHAGVPT